MSPARDSMATPSGADISRDRVADSSLKIQRKMCNSRGAVQTAWHASV